MRKKYKYISREGWQVIVILIMGLYFPTRALLYYGYSI